MNVPSTVAPGERRRHGGVLAAAVVVGVAAFLLEVRPDDRVALRGLARYPLPPVCPARAWFGVACPGCGMTRAVVHLARGDWRASLRSHRLGWLVATLIVAQVPYRLWALRRAGRVPPVGPVVATAFASLLAALFLGNWVFGLMAHRVR